MPQASRPELGGADYCRSSSCLSTLTLKVCLSEGMVCWGAKATQSSAATSFQTLTADLRASGSRGKLFSQQNQRDGGSTE